MEPSPHEVLAQPLRARIVLHLRSHGRATSADLARALDSNTGVISYHVRRLHEAGLVLDGGRQGRRRWWVAGPDVAVAELLTDDQIDSDDESGTRWLARDYVLHYAERNLRWIDDQEQWPARWRLHTGLQDHLLLLTAPQLAELTRELEATMERYRRKGAGNPTAKRVAFYTCAIPVDAPSAESPPGVES